MDFPQEADQTKNNENRLFFAIFLHLQFNILLVHVREPRGYNTSLQFNFFLFSNFKESFFALLREKCFSNNFMKIYKQFVDQNFSQRKVLFKPTNVVNQISSVVHLLSLNPRQKALIHQSISYCDSKVKIRFLFLKCSKSLTEVPQIDMSKPQNHLFVI